MKIKSFVETSYKGMYKLTSEEGSSFYMRKEYSDALLINFDLLEAGYELNEQQTENCLDNGLCCAAEFKALQYLARAEQSYTGLYKKLLDKGHKSEYAAFALSYLERIGYLSDRRFARAWLNSRRTNHYEGKSRLLAELTKRGISKATALDALDEFFQENDEEEILAKAYEKLSKNKSGDKLIAALMQAGFSYKQIKEFVTF